jgi:hypothetical protein
VLASLLLAPAAFAQPPAERLLTYEDLTCGAEEKVNLHVAGAIRLWDDDGDSFLLRRIVQNDENHHRSWGRGRATPGAITCTGENFELQGFPIDWVELVVVPLPREG